MWMKVAAVTRIMHCMISRKHTESVTQKAAVCMQLWCLPYGMDMLLTGECLQYTYYEPVTNGHTWARTLQLLQGKVHTQTRCVCRTAATKRLL